MKSATQSWLRPAALKSRRTRSGRRCASGLGIVVRVPVSTPLAWNELTEGLRPRDFSMPVVLDRVARLGDLFEPVLRGGPALGPALRALR